jgi:nucleoside-diphosphate-sugar epimerase
MKKTVFVTGGSGFIGTELCRASVAAGDEIIALCRSKESARKIKALGATPVEGDLLDSGVWENQARAAEYVIHLAQPAVFGARVTTRRAESYRRRSLSMDKNLLAALDPRRIKRVVYVSGTCYYGDLGTALCNEAVAPNPHGIGRFIIDNVDMIDRCQKDGLPIVTAFPGVVYGPGSWFREYLFAPLARGKRLFTWGDRSPSNSPIHVCDCARALAYLLEHGGVGEHYFLVDDKPVQWSTLQMLVARALGVAPKLTRVPAWLAAVLLGRVAFESLGINSVLSNAKLKALGFVFRYPTIDTGVPAVVAQLRSATNREGTEACLDALHGR